MCMCVHVYVCMCGEGRRGLGLDREGSFAHDMTNNLKIKYI